MRPIKESTYNAIKSRNLTGENRFTHRVSVENVDSYGPPTLIKTVSLGSAIDFAHKTDGSILFAYRVGLNVYVKTIIDDEALIVANGVGTTGGTLVMTMDIGAWTNDNISVSMLKNGKLILSVSEGNAGSLNFKIRHYVSNNGVGNDFVYLSTSSSIVAQAVFIDGSDNAITKIVENSNGTLFFLASKPWEYDSNHSMLGTASFVSYDSGLTWIQKMHVRGLFYRPTGNIGSITIKNDYVDLFIGCSVDTYGGFNIAFHIGWDNGASWNYYSKEHWTYGCSVGEDDEYFYIFAQVEYSVVTIYRRKKRTVTSINDFLDFTKLEIYIPAATTYSAAYQRSGYAIINKEGWIYYLETNKPTRVYFRERGFMMGISSISISKSHGGASTATIQVDNKNGVVNPRNQDGPLYKILGLNKQIVIQQGYGDDIVDSFTGIIDSIDMKTWPQVATISLRDNFKKALDQTITKAGKNVVKYTNQPIETIVADLCALCGLTVGYIEPTGITIEKEFSWQSYADALQFLSDIASFEYLCDESGKFHFRRDFQPGNMSVAWSFEEGVDITDMSYTIDDNDLYNSVRVYGTSGEDIIVYNAPFLDAAQFNILPQKVLKIDATEASTVNELRKIAERAISTMRSRTRVINFTAIAVPHLQSGDFIQIFESSTDTHEIYRLTSIGLNMDSKKFTMSCTAYYYGDSIVPGELPDTTGTQTVDPNLNLIPNMTSNTAPSGVARASSVYKDWAATYSPWRSLNGNNQDYFWDANAKVAWLEYEFPQKMIIDKYVLRARELILYNLAMPKDFTFEAFDGEKWIVLDTRINQTAWKIYEERSFKFTNTTAYAKYRINITRNNGYTRTQFERLKMYYGGGA